MKIKRKHLQRLIESMLFETKRGSDGPVWNYSPDSDFPASALKPKTNMPLGKANKAITDPFYEALHSERALLLRRDDIYTLTPNINTHGGESHALKHLAEVDPQLVLDTMNDCIVLLGQAVEKGEIINPIRCDWQSGGVFITPAGWWHSHHNESDKTAWVLPMQDAGLYTHQRTLDIRFVDDEIELHRNGKIRGSTLM